MAKSFVYSLDAFISVLIIILAIYILSFSNVFGGSYYSVIYQAKLLATDSLKLLVSSGDLNKIINPSNPGEGQAYCAADLNSWIPPQFGYELSIKRGDSWDIICNKSSINDSVLVVQSAYVVSLKPDIDNSNGYSNPYHYKTCNGRNFRCNLISNSEALISSLRPIMIRLRVFQ